MMNQNDAHSGANPEPENEPNHSAPIVESTSDDEYDDDDDDWYEVIDGGTMSDPTNVAAKPLPPPPPVPASGTLPILDAQLGEGLKIMQDFAAWFRHPRTEIETCIHVARAVGELMTASAALGKVATRLQNGDPESRHRVIVEYPEGGGVAPSRKRINHGRG
jgi:hypothetical protein